VAGEADVGTKKIEPVAGLAARSADELRKDVVAASGVFLFGFALYLLPAVCSRPLSSPSEARVAVVAREMLRSGDYVVPHLGGEPCLDQPPLPYWLAAGAARMLSGGEEANRTVMTRAALLPPALLGALALFIVVLYGSVVFGRPAGVMAGLMLGCSLLVCRFAQLGSGDMALLFTCAGLCCGAAWLVSVPRPGILAVVALSISLGLGILAGGLVPALFLAGPVLVEVLIRRRFSVRKVLLFLLALAVAAAIAAPWFVAVSERHPEAWAALLQGSREAIGAEGPVREDRLYFYFLRLAGGLLPWTIVLVAAWPLSLKLCLESKRDVSGPGLLAHNQVRFLVLFFCLGFLGLYALPAQHARCLLPLLPALALASGYVLSHFKAPGGMAEESLAWTQLGLGLAGGILIALLPLWLSGVGESSGKAVALLQEPGGWAISVPLGLAFFILQFYCARQWVEGQPAAAALALALCAYAGLAAWSWDWARRSEKTLALKGEAQVLHDKLSEQGQDVRVYAVGMSQAMLEHYLDLGRPVFAEKHLSTEPRGQTGADAPQRIFVVRRQHLPETEKDYDLAEKDCLIPLDSGATSAEGAKPFVLLRLPPGKDWPEQAAAARPARPQKPTE